MSQGFVEIERKFLVRPVVRDMLASNAQVIAARHYEQAYVVTGGIEVRIRRDAPGGRPHSYRLAVKQGLGFVRDEVEIEVPNAAGDRLFEMAGDRRLSKTRFELPDGWTLDELHGRLAGVWILEIELPDTGATLPPFPAWLQVIDDVTDDPRFKTQRIVTWSMYDMPAVVGEIG